MSAEHPCASWAGRSRPSAPVGRHVPLEMPYLHWCAPHRAPHAGRRNAEKGRFKTIYFVYDRAQIHVELNPAIIRCTQVRRKAPREPRYGPGPQGWRSCSTRSPPPLACTRRGLFRSSRALGVHLVCTLGSLRPPTSPAHARRAQRRVCSSYVRFVISHYALCSCLCATDPS